MRKIIIASIILVAFNYLLGTLYCKTWNLFDWGGDTCLFFWVSNITGIVGFIGFINENYRNISHLAIWCFLIITGLFFLDHYLLH